jgi:pyridoxamine 5'-phosphate oxidase
MTNEIKPDYYRGPQAGDFAAAADPFALFEAWFREATAHEPNDPNAFALATVDAAGLPNVRMVLLKGVDAPDHPARGFVFYTNFESTKGEEILASRKAALNFHWKSLRRQIRIRGAVSIVSNAEADLYFATRPRGSQIGAWASQQSRLLASREALEREVAAVKAKHPGEIPRPPHWSGFRVTPFEIEFWHDRPFRLHERITFRRDAVESTWEKQRLFP